MAVLRASSPIATALLALLLLPRPVTAVPHNHHHHMHMHRDLATARDPVTLGPESLARRDTQPDFGSNERMDPEEATRLSRSCENGPLKWPLPGVPPPQVNTVFKQPTLFDRPESTPGQLVMQNHCDYDLYWERFNGAEQPHGSLPAKQTTSVPLKGTVVKVSLREDHTLPLQIEFSHDSYDLSLIDCLKQVNEMRTTDASSCPGWEAGLQLSSPHGKAFQCAPNAWCDDQAYLYEVSNYFIVSLINADK